VSSNGYLTFGIDGTDFSNDPIPNATDPNDIICPFWDDLSPNIGGSIHYLSTSTQFIVQYTNIPRWSDGSSLMTFQVILNDDGSILFQYYSMVGLLHYSTIGIENATGDDGLQVAYNEAYIHDNLAVKISLPEPCPWITSVLPISGTLSSGNSDDVTVSVDATGLASGSYDCELLIYSNDVNTSLVTVPVTLNVGPCYGNITLSTQAEVDAFSCNEITGNLTISGADINDLSPLSSLTSVGGILYIAYNDALTNLDGLSSLTSVGDFLAISDNSALDEFCGLYELLVGGGLLGFYSVAGNAANPTQQEIIDGGACPGPCVELVTNTTQSTTYCTFQEAIAAANADDNITIGAGTLVESGQIVIDKNLTISGAGKAETIIMTDINTGTSGDPRGWWLVNDGIELNLSDLTLDGTGYLIWQAIRVNDRGSDPLE
jgi:hypothetical protein